MGQMIKILCLLIMLFSLTGCGDLLKNDVIKKEIDSTQFSAECGQPDIDQFSLFLKENISSQIRCLGENLNLFIRMVETDKEGYMNRAALEAFIKLNMKDVKPEYLKALKSVYDLNYLLTGEYREYISKRNVDELIDFAILLNAEMAVTIGPLFSGKKKIKYTLHDAQRKWVNTSSKKIIMGLHRIFNQNQGGSKRDLNIVKLLESFITDATEDDIAKIMKFLFLKKVMFGGEREILTHEQLKDRVLINFDQIVLSIFDIVKYQLIEDFTQERIFDLLQRNVKNLGDIIMQPSMGDRDKELFFTMDEAIEVAETFIKEEDFKISEWKNIILELKSIYMGGNSTEVRGLDFKNLLGHANNVLKTGSVFYRIWAKFTPAMESPLPVTVDFSEYKHTYPQEAEELDHFERIVKKYRFFRGKFESAYYTKGIRRNSDAIVETYMIEYLLRQIIKKYGTKDPANLSLGGYGLSREDLAKIVDKIEPDLIRLKLSTKHKKDSLIDNISLLGTLFQYQSDKNGFLDANEATEFAVALLTSLDMTSVMMDYFRTKGCAFDTYGRVEPTCMKQNYFKGICEGFDDGNESSYRDGYRTFLPMMFEYLGAKTCAEVQNSTPNVAFLDASIGAARGCNYYEDAAGKPTAEEIYYSEGDIMSTLVVMMHAEATTLRWDDVNNKGNGNNLLDASEMNSAYSIYSPALDGFLETKPGIIKSLKKQIYQYLIKYETVPDEKQFSSIWKFIKFLVSFDKKAPAYRKTLASILFQIGEQNKITSINAGKPQFKCNWLKDPDHIPDDMDAPDPLTNIGPASDYSHLLNFLKPSSKDENGDPNFTYEKELCLTLFNKQICL